MQLAALKTLRSVLVDDKPADFTAVRSPTLCDAISCFPCFFCPLLLLKTLRSGLVDNKPADFTAVRRATPCDVISCFLFYVSSFRSNT
jgi:hypothetical protein